MFCCVCFSVTQRTSLSSLTLVFLVCTEKFFARKQKNQNAAAATSCLKLFAGKRTIAVLLVQRRAFSFRLASNVLRVSLFALQTAMLSFFTKVDLDLSSFGVCNESNGYGG